MVWGGGSSMELRQLRHFMAVVRLANISAAAEQLGLTQPALSKSIRMLEQSLGVRLLDRGPAGVRMTLFGERLKVYADMVLALSDEAREEIDALRGARRGSLRIGCVAAVLRSLVPQAVAALKDRYPDVDIVVSEGLNDTLVDALRSGRLDVAIAARPDSSSDPDLEFRILLEEPIEFIAGPCHPLAGRTRVELADLVPFAWLVPPRPEPDRLKLDGLFVASGLPKPRTAIETTSVVFLSAVLLDSDHLSYLTRSSLQAQTNVHSRTGEPNIVPLRLTFATWNRTTCAVFRRQSVVRPTVLAFLRQVEAICATLGRG
jgi:DNA-binding transcriptional LysR family regulator